MIDFTNVKELLVNGESVKEFRVGDSVLWRKRSVLGTSLVLSSDVSTTVGPVTLTAVLQAEDSTFVSGATVTFYDSLGNSLGFGITNMNGIATLDLVITSNITIYCVFNGTSDYNECTSNEITIEVENYLFYDKCDNASGLSNYGSPLLLEGGATPTLSFNSSEVCYEVNSEHKAYCFPILALDNEDNFCLEAEVYYDNSTYQSGVSISQGTGTGFILIFADNTITRFNYQGGSYSGSAILTAGITNGWHNLKVIIEGTSFRVYVDDNLIGSYTHSFINVHYGIGGGGSHKNLIKNIIAEAL